MKIVHHKPSPARCVLLNCGEALIEGNIGLEELAVEDGIVHTGLAEDQGLQSADAGPRDIGAMRVDPSEGCECSATSRHRADRVDVVESKIENIIRLKCTVFKKYYLEINSMFVRMK